MQWARNKGSIAELRGTLARPKQDWAWVWGPAVPTHGWEDNGGAQGRPDGTDLSLRKATVFNSSH